MKEFKNIKDYLKNLQSHNSELNNEKEKLLKELDFFQDKISNFKSKVKSSNKQYKLDNFKNKAISELPHIFSKSLFGKYIKIKEKNTEKVFSVKVSDYCFDDQKGVIVRFKESDNPRLNGLIRKYDLLKEETIYGQKKNFRGGDFRNIFPHGKDWIFLEIDSKDFQ